MMSTPFEEFEKYNAVRFEIKVSIAIIKNAINVIEDYYNRGKIDELDLEMHISSIRKNNEKLDGITQKLLHKCI